MDAEELVSLPKSRSAALLLGVKHYFKGEPCKWGHVSARYARCNHCLTCNDSKSAAFRLANPEKERAWKAAYRLANPEKVRALKAAYRLANPEKVRAQKAAWRLANPEKANALSASQNKRSADELRDSYLAFGLSRVLDLPRSQIPADLIALKRAEIKLHRLIKAKASK